MMPLEGVEYKKLEKILHPKKKDVPLQSQFERNSLETHETATD